MKDKLVLTFLTVLALTARVLPIQAQEITVEGNGAGAVSTALVEQSQQTTVTQTNEAIVANTVNIAANTGGNTVSDTNGETTIETGNINETINLATTTNTNTVVTDTCCQQTDAAVVIAGNGTESVNTVDVAQTHTVVVNAVNTATVINTISGSAVTGNNTVEKSEGNVSVTTGNITVKVHLDNQANSTQVKICCEENENLSVKIAGNGNEAVNTVSYANNQATLVNQSNTSFLTNTLWFYLVTGNNVVSETVGDVSIKTGDILLEAVITNKTNENTTEIGCCEKDEDGDGDNNHDDNDNNDQTPTIVNPPTTTSSTDNDDNNDTNNGDSGRGGQVLGAILPATGSRDFMWMLIANILTFLFGCYLRRYSGRAPAQV